MQFMLVAGIAILCTLVLCVAFFYRFFQKEVMDNLKMDAYMLKSVAEESSWEKQKEAFATDNFRETIIAADGTVIFDSEADSGEMENHGERPEIEQAFSCGEGSDIRHSLTRGKSTFYFAVLLEDGSVLRIAREAGSPRQVYESVLPGVLVMALVLFVLCILLSHFLTRSIVMPIEHLAGSLDRCDPAGVYRELRPFIRTIKAQHEDILKHADMRQEFTANVSHELKTPLTAISGYSELIETGMAADQDVIRFAGEIRRSSNRLLTLINDIIRLSELDASPDGADKGKDTVDLYDLAKDCVEMLSVAAKKHHVTMELCGESTVFRSDKRMIEELLYNLCDNAIRYNKEGGTVKVETKQEENGIKLTVEDTGIGIPKEHQERIFERFYRVDKSRSKQTGGTGLGLAIVKHIVAKQGAALELASEEGKGTKITVLFEAK
jgi:two-component system phosphate regulon sensor histidine kinase PhoR